MRQADSHQPTPLLLARLEREARIDIFVEVLDSMPTAQLLVIVMHYFEHFDLQDIAAARGCHARTVSRLHADALGTLRQRCAVRGLTLKDLLP